MEPFELGIKVAIIAVSLLTFYMVGRRHGHRKAKMQHRAPAELIYCAHSQSDVAGGCEWIERYDISASALNLDDAGSVDQEYLEDLAEKYRTETYVRDICVKCGRTAERSSTADNITKLANVRVQGVHAGQQLYNEYRSGKEPGGMIPSPADLRKLAGRFDVADISVDIGSYDFDLAARGLREWAAQIEREAYRVKQAAIEAREPKPLHTFDEW